MDSSISSHNCCIAFWGYVFGYQYSLLLYVLVLLFFLVELWPLLSLFSLTSISSHIKMVSTPSCFVTASLFFLMPYIHTHTQTHTHSLFRATPMAYGCSQARGRIRAVAFGLDHSQSNTGSKPHLPSTPQLRAILDP